MRKIALFLSTIAILASCNNGRQANPDTAATAATTSQTAPATNAATSTTATNGGGHPAVVAQTKAPYGPYLTDANGRTLYMFTGDTRDIGRSACGPKCAAQWPPVTNEGALQAAGGAQSNLLGAFKRPDGSTQITYNGWPLYYSGGDRRPGVVNGEGVVAFGGRWFVVSPQGNKIEM